MEFVTPQEQQLLSQLTQRINATQLQEKDPDAENLLGHELGANPDAVYILAQTVLVQNIALEQAKAQVTQLQQQVQQAQQVHQPAHATSFLGRLLGDRDQEQAQPQPPPYQPVPPQYAQQAPPQYAQPVPPQYAPQGFMPVQSGPPSFLRGAMQTAAEVAAGALAFEGVESVLHGFGHGGGMGMAGMGMMPGMGMGGGFDRPVEETVVNNYYDEPGGGAEHRGLESTGNEPHFHESADQGGAQFSDANYNTTGDDRSGNDQGGFDDSNSNDSSSLDNGGGLDDGGSGFDDGGSFGGDDGSGGDVL
jgi:hypothetical protein